MSIVIPYFEIKIHTFRGRWVSSCVQYPWAVSSILYTIQDDDVPHDSNIFPPKKSCPHVSKTIPKMIADYPFYHKGKIALISRKLIFPLNHDCGRKRNKISTLTNLSKLFQLQAVSRSSLTDETNPAAKKNRSKSSMVCLSHEGGLDSAWERKEERMVNVHTSLNCLLNLRSRNSRVPDLNSSNTCCIHVVWPKCSYDLRCY